MGRIIKKLIVDGGLLDEDGIIVEKRLDVLFRTGVIHSLIKKSVAEEVCTKIPVKPKTLGWYFGGKYQVTDKCVFETIIDNKLVEDTALILDDINWEYDLVIGLETMQRYEMQLEFANESVKVRYGDNGML